MDAFLTFLENTLSVNTLLQWRLIGTVLTVLGIFLVRWIVMALVGRRTEDMSLYHRWRKVVEYTTLILGIFVLGRIWLVGSGSLATYLGLLSAGLAVALREPITNMFGWFFILGRRPFEVGDRIEIGDSAGDVVDIRIFQFSVLEIGNWVEADQSTGRIVHIPNQKVFNEALANYHKGITYIWNEIAVLVTFESDWRKAKGLVLEVVERESAVIAETAKARVRQAARRYLVNYDKLTPIVYTRVKDSGVMLTARYLCDPRRRRGTETAIWEGILDAFSEHPDVELAYPTQRIYYHPREGTGPGSDANLLENSEPAEA
jgi:small-conductance mechanosensitive channel